MPLQTASQQISQQIQYPQSELEKARFRSKIDDLQAIADRQAADLRRRNEGVRACVCTCVNVHACAVCARVLHVCVYACLCLCLPL